MTGLEHQLAQYRSRLEAAGLGVYAEALCSAAAPSVRLTIDTQLDCFAAGASRLGGIPDLPPGVTWPEDDDTPLSFVAQLNLGEIAEFAAGEDLPSSGLLSFFYDSAQMAWGFDPDDCGLWAVLYTDGDTELQPHPIPDACPPEARFQAVGLKPRTELTFVPWESLAFHGLDVTQEQGLAYAAVLPSEDRVIHRLLGHPDPVQGDMHLECQLTSNGIYCGDSAGYKDPHAAQLRQGATDWRLLFQVDSQDEAGMMWGDVGRLYYWIRNDDLASRRWDQTWLVLQCG